MNSRTRWVIIILSVWMVLFQYSILHNYLNQVNLYRYPNIFASFIKMFQKGYVHMNKLSPISVGHYVFSPVGEVSLKAQSIIQTESFFPNLAMLHIVLQYITNMEPYQLILLPIGVFLGPLSYIVLVKNIVKVGSKVRENLKFSVISILSLYGMMYMAGATKIYQGAYVAGIAFPLQFLIIASFMLLIGHGNWKFYLVYIILVFSLTLYWHSSVIGAISMILSMIILLTICSTFSNKNFLGDRSRIIWVAILSLIIVVSFTRLWQDMTYLKITFNAGGKILSEFIHMLMLKLHRGTLSNVSNLYSYRITIWGQAYFILTIMLYFTITLSYILALFILLKDLNKHFENHKVLVGLLSTSPVLAQGIISILYFKTYSINFPYITYYLPIFMSLVFIVKRQSDNRILFFILGGLIVISTILTVLYPSINEGGETSMLKYGDTSSSFYWVYLYIDWDTPKYCDFNIIGKYLYREASIQKPTLNFVDLTPGLYNDILQNDKLKVGAYIIDKKSMVHNVPINVNAHRALLKPYYNRISSNHHLDKIYDDNKVSIHLVE